MQTKAETTLSLEDQVALLKARVRQLEAEVHELRLDAMTASQAGYLD